MHLVPVVAPSSWKSKRDAALFSNSPKSHQIERYLEPDIVLMTKNGQGRGGGPTVVVPGLVHFRLILLTFSVTESYLNAKEIRCTTSLMQFLVIVKIELTSIYVPRNETSWQTLHGEPPFLIIIFFYFLFSIFNFYFLFFAVLWGTNFQTPSWAHSSVAEVS